MRGSDHRSNFLVACWCFLHVGQYLEENNQRGLILKLKELNDAEAERSSPGVVFSECLHGRKELDALLQGHCGFLLLRLKHALMFLIGLDDTLTQILADIYKYVTPLLGDCR